MLKNEYWTHNLPFIRLSTHVEQQNNRKKTLADEQRSNKNDPIPYLPCFWHKNFKDIQMLSLTYRQEI